MEDLSPQDIQKYFNIGHTGFWKQEYAQGKHPNKMKTQEMGMNDHIGNPIDVHKLMQILAEYQNKKHENRW